MTETPRRRALGRWLLGVVGVLVPLLVAGWWLGARYEADRFAHHSVRADAKITGSNLGCLGAYGMPGSGGGSITYDIEFAYAGGTHATSVRRPCDVTPPDFGRGRGAIWVEYDVDDPDRVRVVNDDTAPRRAAWLRQLLVTVLAAEGVILLWRRSRPVSTGEGRSTHPR